MNNFLAQNTINLAPAAGFEALSNLSFESLVSTAITFILIIAAVVFFFMLILGGLKWILSGGDKAQTEAARNQITAALVGLVIVFAAWAIAGIVNQIFQVNIFNITLPQAAV